MDDTIRSLFNIPNDIDLESFNCVGFAFGVYSWLDPSEWLNSDAEFTGKEAIHDLYINGIDTMLKTLNIKARFIVDPNHILPTEDLIIIRYDTTKSLLDCEFHAIRKHDQVWYEKMGEADIMLIPPNIDVINQDWNWRSTVGMKVQSKNIYIALDNQMKYIPHCYNIRCTKYTYLNIPMVLQSEYYEIDLPMNIAWFTDPDEAYNKAQKHFSNQQLVLIKTYEECGKSLNYISNKDTSEVYLKRQGKQCFKYDSNRNVLDPVNFIPKTSTTETIHTYSYIPATHDCLDFNNIDIDQFLQGNALCYQNTKQFIQNYFKKSLGFSGNISIGMVTLGLTSMTPTEVELTTSLEYSSGYEAIQDYINKIAYQYHLDISHTGKTNLHRPFRVLAKELSSSRYVIQTIPIFRGNDCFLDIIENINEEEYEYKDIYFVKLTSEYSNFLDILGKLIYNVPSYDLHRREDTIQGF